MIPILIIVIPPYKMFDCMFKKTLSLIKYKPFSYKNQLFFLKTGKFSIKIPLQNVNIINFLKNV